MRSLLITCLALVLSPVAVVAQGSALIDFEMTDQFDRPYRDSDYRGRILYVIGSDKGGSRFNGAWARAIFEALEQEHAAGDVASFGLADLRGVPFFIKGLVKGKFPQEEEKWVVMDWKGRFSKAYGFEPGSSNILVFAPDGRLVHQAHGREVERQILEGIVGELLELQELLVTGSN